MENSTPFQLAIVATEKAIKNKSSKVDEVKRDIKLMMNPVEFTQNLHNLGFNLGRVMSELECKKLKLAIKNDLLKEQENLNKEIRRIKRMNCAKLFQLEWDLTEEIEVLKGELEEIKEMSSVVQRQRVGAITCRPA